MLDNLLKEYYTTKSPHLIISRQWFFKIKKNTITLKNARECADENGKKVYYEIDKIGSNVRYVQKKDVFVLNPSTMSRNIIFIIVRLADLSHIEKLQFHTRLGHMIQKYNLKTTKINVT